MFVCALRIELHLPNCHSLKEKRAVLRPLIDGLRARHSVSIAEVEYHDLWQRAAIGIAVVGSEAGHVQRLIDECERFVWTLPEMVVTNAERTWLE